MKKVYLFDFYIRKNDAHTENVCVNKGRNYNKKSVSEVNLVVIK